MSELINQGVGQQLGLTPFSAYLLRINTTSSPAIGVPSNDRRRSNTKMQFIGNKYGLSLLHSEFRPRPYPEWLSPYSTVK